MKCFNSRRMASLLAVALVVAALSGCGGNASGQSDPPAGSGSPSQGSTPSPDASSSGETTLPPGDSLEGDGPQKAVRTLVEGLMNKDAAAIAAATNTPLDTYDDWLTVDLSAVSAKVLSEENQSGSFALTFQVKKSDSPFFPVGTYTRRVEVGYPAFGDGETAIISLQGPQELDPYLREKSADRPGYQAFSQVANYLDLMETITFPTVEDIPDSEIVDYALIHCSMAMPDRYYYSKEEVQSAIKTLFALPYFDPTTTQYYDKAENRFEVWGRGGYYRNYLVPAVTYDAATRRFTVEARLYLDPLCAIPEETILYTLGENDDESLYFISAIPT